MTHLTDSDDGLPPEAVGVARLSETLQAHMWPNMTMKGRDPTKKQEGSDSEASESNKDTVSEGLEKLEAKAAASGATKEESQKRVGKSPPVSYWALQSRASTRELRHCVVCYM